jgi:hypothetical protein
VNSRTHPEKAVVTLEVSIPSLGKTATISRNVKSARAPTITPDEPEIRKALAHAESHPEFALSRREIIKYVLAEPGERAREIQALLQLDKLGTVRSLLLRISNGCARELKPLEAARIAASENLMRALGVDNLKQATALEAVNTQRKVLGLTPLAKIEAGTSIKDGLESQDSSAKIKVPKTQAKDDVAAATSTADQFASEEAEGRRTDVVESLKKLQANEAKLTSVAREAMLKTALDLFDEQECPVCETPWKPDEFRAVVQEQRKLLEDAAKDRATAEADLAPHVAALEDLSEQFSSLRTYARNLPDPIDVGALTDLAAEIQRRLSKVRGFLPLDETIAAIGNEIAELKPAVDLVAKIAAAVDSLPEPSDRDAARDYLTVGQERLEAWRQAASRHSAAQSRADVAERVHKIYGATCDKALEAIYKDVETEFRGFYRTINGDDESKFEAQLTPSLGKLGFEVDFYGKGFFPPGAYHSEGHQDGMGLCLYLALMKHLLGDGFTFAVLDDVLMSVDAGHRREVCSLLKSVFPNTQFVLTTHDQVWLNHMRTSKLVEGKGSITFRKWHVDQGPAEWKDTDVWTEIDDLVSKNEIRAAAAQLRHYLEYLSAEWCSRLAGRVEYRADGKYELGDLLPAAVAAMNEAYKKAKVAAQSWGDKERVAELGTMHDGFSQAVSASNVEQWQLNPAVHFNEWENLQKEDFAPVVESYKELEKAFSCPSCGEPLYVVRSGKQKEEVRCACSKVTLNLKPKSAA